MTEYIEKLDERMIEIRNALHKKQNDPQYGFEEISSVDMLIKFIVNFNTEDENVKDGVYIYMDEGGDIVNAEFFVKENSDVTIVQFDEEQLEIIIELFKDVFTINVD